jgi:hypothetical protein
MLVVVSSYFSEKKYKHILKVPVVRYPLYGLTVYLTLTLRRENNKFLLT